MITTIDLCNTDGQTETTQRLSIYTSTYYYDPCMMLGNALLALLRKPSLPLGDRQMDPLAILEIDADTVIAEVADCLPILGRVTPMPSAPQYHPRSTVPQLSPQDLLDHLAWGKSNMSCHPGNASEQLPEWTRSRNQEPRCHL